jgi:hypothetical protein
MIILANLVFTKVLTLDARPCIHTLFSIHYILSLIYGPCYCFLQDSLCIVDIDLSKVYKLLCHYMHINKTFERHAQSKCIAKEFEVPKVHM